MATSTSSSPSLAYSDSFPKKTVIGGTCSSREIHLDVAPLTARFRGGPLNLAQAGSGGPLE